MKMARIFIAVLAFTLTVYVLLISSKEIDQVSIPDTPVGRVFADWLEAFNTGNRSEIVAHHEQHHFSSQGPSHDIANIDDEMALRRKSGGFHLKSISSDSEATRLTAVLQERDSPQFASFAIELDNADPDRVGAFEFRLIPTPDEFLSPSERAKAIAARSLDPDRRGLLIDGIVRELQDHYFDPDVGQRMIEALKRNAANGVYDKITLAPDFAEAVTNDFREISHDFHFLFNFEPNFRAEMKKADELAIFRDLHYGFEETQHLHGNVACLTIRGFIPSDDEEVRDAIANRMTEIADAEALLVDLRNNHGGLSKTVSLIASYFFDEEPVHVNDLVSREDGGSVEELWTQPSVKGKRYGGKKPIYVLTSHQTVWVAEEFAYDLQSLQRAKIIGETTAGIAHPWRPFELDESFVLVIPNMRPINPITKTNWEGVGVVPDVPISAEAAFDEAYKLAREGLALVQAQ